jgi:glycosyltransferase involved in cell wall biosynthesis
MRIGIDGGCLSNRRGFGRFARELTGALAAAGSEHEFVVFVDQPSADRVTVPDGFARVVVPVREAPSRAASATTQRSVRDMLAMTWAAARSRLDLLFFPATYSFFPVWNVPRVVVTMHDTLALAHPEWVFPTWTGRAAWALKEYAAVRQADRILTVSQAARRDLQAWFRLPDGRIRVVPEGPDVLFQPLPAGPVSDAILARYGVRPGERFLLYVGGLSPHKNLLRLVEAYALLPDPPRLCLVGDTGDVFHTHVPEIQAAIARLGLADRVGFTGFVPDSDLAHLYSRAYALVQPSLMEGFGLPAVESMACGTPVISSTAGSLPEVIGEAGVYFDPTDVADLARALREVLADPEARMRLAGVALERAKQYTWAASAQAVLACFAELEPARARRRSA